MSNGTAGESFKALRDVTEDEEFQPGLGCNWYTGTLDHKRWWSGTLYVKVRPAPQRWVAEGENVRRGSEYVYYVGTDSNLDACPRARRLADLLNREGFE